MRTGITEPGINRGVVVAVVVDVVVILAATVVVPHPPHDMGHVMATSCDPHPRLGTVVVHEATSAHTHPHDVHPVAGSSESITILA